MFNSKLNFIIKRIIKIAWNSDITILVNKTTSIISQLLKNNGTLYTVKYLKTCRLVITRYMSGKRLNKVDSFVSIQNGFPTKFLFMKEYIDSRNIIKIKIILTLLNISRTIHPTKDEKIPVSYNSITDPYKGKCYTIPSWFIKSWLLKITNKKVLAPVTRNNFYMSLKQGPHGPTILSLVNSIKLYTHNNILNLMVLAGKPFVDNLFGPFFSYVNHNELDIPKGPSRRNRRFHEHKALGRIAIVKDPECKMRPIAMIDYYSQITLKPISDTIFDILSKMSQDRTYSQNPHNDWEGEDDYWSLDLTAATDRFPIDLQVKLLSYLYEKGWLLSKHWKSILHDRDYITPEGNLLRYAVGQPMGSYSSWSTFALTHHLVVAWAAHLCGKDNFKNYILLGDDIVIKDNRIARRYIKVMTMLGVDISMHKTHRSNNSYEFAKRWIRNGKEISGLPLRGIFDNLKNPLILYLVLLDYFTIKGNTYLGPPLRTLVERVLHRLTLIHKGKKIIFSPKWVRRNLWFFSATVRQSLGLATDEEVRFLLATYSAKQDWLPLPSDITILWKRVISNGLAELVKENTGKILKSGDYIWKYLTILVPDLNQISTFPFLIAISNYLERTISSVNHWLLYNNKNNDDQIDLITVVKEINFLDFNKVAIWDRNWFPAALISTKLIKQSIRYLSNSEGIEDFYFDSLTISGQKEKMENIRFNSLQTLKRISPILEKKYNNLPPQAVAMIKLMSKRHGGAFWL